MAGKLKFNSVAKKKRCKKGRSKKALLARLPVFDLRDQSS